MSVQEAQDRQQHGGGVRQDKRIRWYATYQHLRASMSFPGMSRHLRIRPVWWRTASRASLSRRAWSSGGAGVAIMASDRLLNLRIDCFLCSR